MNDASVQRAVQLFKENCPDFVDFENPGTDFEENENRYKRDILASWQAENGPMRLRELAAAGEGVDALKFFRKATGSPLEPHPEVRLPLPLPPRSES